MTSDSDFHSTLLNDLPDLLLLNILTILPVKERCISARVCRRWRNITRDNSLWRHVDLTPYRLNIKKVWKLIRGHFSECLLTLKLKGYMDKDKHTKWKKATLSNAMLEDLRSRCPNIREMHLYQVNIDNVDSARLPPSLLQVTISKCTWPVGWMKNAALPHLQYLDISDTSRIDDMEVASLTKFTNLEYINVGNCYRISDKGVQVIADNFSSLKTLNLTGIHKVNDLAIHHLCRGIPKLTSLTIRACNNVSKSGIATIATGLKELRYLNIARDIGEDVDNDDTDISCLYKLRHLEMLVCGEDVSEHTVEDMKCRLPRCMVQIESTQSTLQALPHGIDGI